MSESKFKRSVMRRHVSTSWTELVKVAESDSITWGARVYSNSYRGFVLIRRSDPSHKRRTEESRGGGRWCSSFNISSPASRNQWNRVSQPGLGTFAATDQQSQCTPLDRPARATLDVTELQSQCTPFESSTNTCGT